MVQIQIKSSRRLDRTAEIESKKSIKRRFQSDLKQNLAGGRLDHISLEDREERVRVSVYNLVFVSDYLSDLCVVRPKF